MYHVVCYIHSTYSSYNWKFISFNCLHPVAPNPIPRPPPLETTNVILFSEFVFEVYLTCNANSYNTICADVLSRG